MFKRSERLAAVEQAEKLKKYFTFEQIDTFIEEMEKLISQTQDEQSRYMLYMSLASGYGLKHDYLKARDVLIKIDGRKLKVHSFPIFVVLLAYYDLLLGFNDEAISILKNNEKLINKMSKIYEVAKYTEYNVILIYGSRGKMKIARELLENLKERLQGKDVFIDDELAEVERKLMESENN